MLPRGITKEHINRGGTVQEQMGVILAKDKLTIAAQSVQKPSVVDDSTGDIVNSTTEYI